MGFWKSAIAASTQRRPSLSWAVLALSLGCQAGAGFMVLSRGTPFQAGSLVPIPFWIPLAASVVLTLGMFHVRTKKRFRILLAPRILALGLLLALAAEQRGADIVLTLPLLLEISITEPFPANLLLCAVAIPLSEALRLLVLSGGGAAELRFLHADWLAVSVLFSTGGSLMLHYRERMIGLEQECRRLDVAIGELTSANLGYQEHATVLEQRTMLEERKRITREIHDIIGYTLTNNIMMMEAAVEAVRRDPARASEIITEARHNAEEGLDGIRNALYLLRAQEDQELTGIDMIARLASNFHAATGVTVRLEYGNARGSMSQEIESAMYHIIQEALTNSFRHGRATNVEILFWIRDDRTLILTVSDNGEGAASVHEGIGTAGMRERLQFVGGTLRLSPSPHGFTVTVEVPLTGAAGSDGAGGAR